MTMMTTNCPHCDCSYRLERGDEIRTKDCAACGDELCESCPQFECEECNERFCDAHKVAFDDFNLCPHCAGVFVEDARNEMRLAIESATERRLNGAKRRAA